MKHERLISSLHEYEKRMLKLLKDKKELDVEEIAKITNLPKDSVEKATLWAKLKGVVDTREEVTEYLELTDEGLTYAEEGLPEKRLLSLVNDGLTSIEELKKRVDNFHVALVWVKKNGWVSISEGRLAMTPTGKNALMMKTPTEKVLSILRLGRRKVSEIDPSIAETLRRRGLVKVRKSVKKTVYLTKLGKEIAPRIRIEEEIVQLTPEILKNRLWKKRKIRAYDVTIPVATTHPGKRHFMYQAISYIRKIWLEMGFKEMTGPILEVSFWNFDALYQPQDHPARDLADTFYMKIPESGALPEEEIVEAVKATHENGWTCNSTGWQYKWDPEFARKCILRTHTTSLSARTLAVLRKDIEQGALPAKYFSVGRVFRNETLDWKHLAEFYQTDGIVVGENVNFRHLLGYLKEYYAKLGFKKVRFRPAYFPYTEMSTEAEVWNPEHKEWMELVGAGIFRPEVVKPLLGIEIPVLAWGPSLERIVMDKYGINDMRELYWNDIKKLREIKMWVW